MARACSSSDKKVEHGACDHLAGVAAAASSIKIRRTVVTYL